MDPVNNLNQIMQILRQRLTQKTESKNKLDTHSNSSSTQKKRTLDAHKASTDEVMRNINKRINALGPEGHRSATAVKIFIETVLVWEFGNELLQDDQFTIIINDVQKTILENQSTHNKLLSLLDKL